MNIKQFKREQREALLSLDLAKVRAYMLKWDGKAIKKRDGSPMDDETLLVAIHKARSALPTLPVEAQMESVLWLTERGFKVGL